MFCIISNRYSFSSCTELSAKDTGEKIKTRRVADKIQTFINTFIEGMAAVFDQYNPI